MWIHTVGSPSPMCLFEGILYLIFFCIITNIKMDHIISIITTTTTIELKTIHMLSEKQSSQVNGFLSSLTYMRLFWIIFWLLGNNHRETFSKKNLNGKFIKKMGGLTNVICGFCM